MEPPVGKKKRYKLNNEQRMPSWASTIQTTKLHTFSI